VVDDDMALRICNYMGGVLIRAYLFLSVGVCVSEGLTAFKNGCLGHEEATFPIILSNTCRM
jgi:hypothetical protein